MSNATRDGSLGRAQHKSHKQIQIRAQQNGATFSNDESFFNSLLFLIDLLDLSSFLPVRDQHHVIEQETPIDLFSFLETDALYTKYTISRRIFKRVAPWNLHSAN